MLSKRKTGVPLVGQSADFNDAIERDYALYVAHLKQQEEYLGLSDSEKKEFDNNFQLKEKTFSSKVDFKSSPYYVGASREDREKLDRVLKHAKEPLQFKILYFKDDAEAQAFAKKYGVTLIKIDLPKEPRLDVAREPSQRDSHEDRQEEPLRSRRP